MNATINYEMCVCGDCLDCRPDLFPIKPNQCVVCGCYNLSEFKKVQNKHIHCLDCYRQVVNAKRREQRKEKKDLCKCCGKKHGKDECEGVNCGACNDHDYYPLTLLDGVMRCSFCVDDYNNGLECECCGMCDKSVGLSTGENGLEMHVCDLCDIDGSNYDGWGDEKEEEVKPKNDWEDYVNLWREEDCIEPCKCTDAMDIRGRCQIDKAGFTKCPAFADTACFCICNDSDLDMKIQASENLGINCTPIIIQWLSDRSVPADLHEPILNLYNEWRVDERESPNVYPYKKCSECGERKSCGCYQDDYWFCEDCAEEEEEDCRTKPCSCGCGYLGGSCDKGLAIDNGEDDDV